jgi:hypothetical protein
MPVRSDINNESTTTEMAFTICAFVVSISFPLIADGNCIFKYFLKLESGILTYCDWARNGMASKHTCRSIFFMIKGDDDYNLYDFYREVVSEE